MSPTALTELIIGAILLAGLYASMSFGLALIYGVMKIINLAHAGAMMWGAYLAYWLLITFNLSPFLAPLVVVPIFFLLGMAMQRVLIRPIIGAPPIASLLLLFGTWLIMQNVAYLLFGGDTRSLPPKYTLAPLHVAGVVISTNRLIIFVVAVVALVALQLFLSRTNVGRAIRAVSADAEAAQFVGINVQRISMLAFGMGIALAALAGSLMTLLYSFDPDFGRTHLLKSFSIVVLGGLESFVGVALGSLILALAEALSVGAFQMRAALQDLVSFVLLVVVLLVMPNGLMTVLKRRR